MQMRDLVGDDAITGERELCCGGGVLKKMSVKRPIERGKSRHSRLELNESVQVSWFLTVACRRL